MIQRNARRFIRYLKGEEAQSDQEKTPYDQNQSKDAPIS